MVGLLPCGWRSRFGSKQMQRRSRQAAKHIYRSTYNAGRNRVLGGVEENSEEAGVEVR